MLSSTGYTFFWFRPSHAQRTHGARWLRCDAALAKGKGIQALPRHRRPFIHGDAVPDNQRRCLTAKSFFTTTCNRGHVYRATGVFTINSTKYPGRDAITKAANHRCPSLVNSRQYYFTWKLALYWVRAQDHTVVCYTQTKH